MKDNMDVKKGDEERRGKRKGIGVQNMPRKVHVYLT